MNLKLAVVLGCTGTGCRVQLLDDSAPIETRYSSLVKDCVRIREGQLVALNADVEPPEILWHWVRARVDSFEGSRVWLEAAHRPGELFTAARVSAIDDPLESGQEVWTCGVGHQYEIHDSIADGKPTQPDRLLDYIQSTILMAYTNLPDESC